MSAQANADLARRLYDAFNQGDLEAALGLANDDVVVHLMPFNQVFQGKSGFREFMGGFRRAFPDLTVSITAQVATETHVVSECSWHGTHTGPLMSPGGEIAPTHKSVEGAVFCEVWEVWQGKLAKLRNYQDVSSWLRQLGLVP